MASYRSRPQMVERTSLGLIRTYVASTTRATRRRSVSMLDAKCSKYSYFFRLEQEAIAAVLLELMGFEVLNFQDQGGG